MAYIPRTSFEKAPSSIPMQVKKKHTIRVVSLTGTVLMFCAVVATIAVFAYKQYLDNQLLGAQSELNGLSGADNERKMKEIQVYDRKLTVAHSLLNNHLSISRVLSEIEKFTKQTVRFKTFEYVYDPGFEAEVKLEGDTQALTSVALQKMELLKGSIFSNFVVRSISTASAPDPNVKNVPESSKNPQNVESEGIVKSLGVEFEIVGIFIKDKIGYTGAVPIPQEPTSFDTASSTNTGTDVGEVTPSTSTSNIETP